MARRVLVVGRGPESLEPVCSEVRDAGFHPEGRDDVDAAIAALADAGWAAVLLGRSLDPAERARLERVAKARSLPVLVPTGPVDSVGQLLASLDE